LWCRIFTEMRSCPSFMKSTSPMSRGEVWLYLLQWDETYADIYREIGFTCWSVDPSRDSHRYSTMKQKLNGEIALWGGERSGDCRARYRSRIRSAVSPGSELLGLKVSSCRRSIISPLTNHKPVKH
jgi:hypothetical protein